MNTPTAPAPIESFAYPPRPEGSRGGFVTSYLPDYENGDWVCVEDFCGGCSHSGSREVLNVCAFWSPSRRLVAFGGQWVGTPTMPASAEPTEDDVWEWALRADTIWARRWNAATRKTAKRESTMRATEAHYRKHGYNWVTVTFRGPDGAETVVSQCVGLRTSRELVPIAVRHMVEKMPKGTCLARWQWETGLTEAEVEKRRAKAARKLAKAA